MAKVVIAIIFAFIVGIAVENIRQEVIASSVTDAGVWGCFSPYDPKLEDNIVLHKLANGEPLGTNGTGIDSTHGWGYFTKDYSGQWRLTPRLPIDLNQTIEVRLSKVDERCIQILNERF